jgi:hypothetical protein
MSKSSARKSGAVTNNLGVVMSQGSRRVAADNWKAGQNFDRVRTVL